MAGESGPGGRWRGGQSRVKLRSLRTGRPIQGGEDRRCVETVSSASARIPLIVHHCL
jgi:hypothetical protein